jgi:predicted glycosyltransferase
MIIVFDINHPAHINFFKNAIYKLHEEKNEIFIFGLKRGKVPDILKREFPDFNIKIIGRHRNNVISIIFEANILKSAILFTSLIFKRIDVGVSVGSFTLGACLKILGKKNIQFDDDPESSHNLFLERMTADEIHIPPLIKNADKFVIFNALKEWAYLSPKYFKPNINYLNKYGIEPYKYLFIREVSAGSLNYIDRGSYNIASFSDKLGSEYKIVLSLEDKSKRELYPKEWIILEEPVQDIHSLMYYSRVVISSGDSMAREGSMLGRPSVYCGKRIMEANNVMIKKGILFQIEPLEIPSVLSKIIREEIKIPHQDEFRKILLNEWDDVTEHIINSIKKISKIEK